MRDIIRRNLGYKVISLVLAIVFWLWITMQTDSTLFKNNIPLPLVIYNQPSNLVIISQIPTITVRMDTSSQGINVSDFIASVDLKNAVSGEHSFQVRIQAPEGVTIQSISPASAVIKLDIVKDKIVPVIANVTGTPSSEFVVGQLIITPPVVNVRGPTSVLDKLENVVVDIDVAGAKESMYIARPVTFKDIKAEGIFAADPNLDSMKAFPDAVDIIVPVYSKGTASKTVSLKVNTKGLPAAGMKVRLLTPIPAQVQLLGDAETLKSVQSLDLGTVDITGLSENKTINFPLKSVTLPQGVSFAEGTKLSVLVYIGASSENRTIKEIPVGIKNISQGLTAGLIPSIDVVVNGYPDVLDTLKSGDISAWVDAADMKEGTYADTKVLWQAPAGVTMVNVPKVELVLKTNTAGT